MSISGFIIAGGKSRRFGEDKSGYIYEGKPLIKHVYDIFAKVLDEIYIIGPDSTIPELPGVECYKDLIPDLGPIGGIYTALKKSKTDRIFVSACDLPNINSELMKYMMQIPDSYDAIVPHINGYHEPLHSIYSLKILDRVKSFIDSREKKVTDMLKLLDIRSLTEEEIDFYDNPERIFVNINYQDDLDLIQ
jgi:molybdopterin-guanine dinucleotide biosynthesis protein A